MAEMKWDKMNQDKMKWDTMNWDEMKKDEMGKDELGTAPKKWDFQVSHRCPVSRNLEAP